MKTFGVVIWTFISVLNITIKSTKQMRGTWYTLDCSIEITNCMLDAYILIKYLSKARSQNIYRDISRYDNGLLRDLCGW